MLIRDQYGVEIHLNPNHVVAAFVDEDGRYGIVLPSRGDLWVDHESYDRIVAWMEAHDD